MTKEELLDLISTARTSSSSAWAARVVVEQTTGPLKLLTDDQTQCDLLYDVADDYLVLQTPILTKVRTGLGGALFLETQRGLTQHAQNAISALNTYEAAPYYGGSFGSSWASAVSVST